MVHAGIRDLELVGSQTLKGQFTPSPGGADAWFLTSTLSQERPKGCGRWEGPRKWFRKDWI